MALPPERICCSRKGKLDLCPAISNWQKDRNQWNKLEETNGCKGLKKTNMRLGRRDGGEENRGSSNREWRGDDAHTSTEMSRKGCGDGKCGYALLSEGEREGSAVSILNFRYARDSSPESHVIRSGWVFSSAMGSKAAWSGLKTWSGLIGFWSIVGSKSNLVYYYSQSVF